MNKLPALVIFLLGAAYFLIATSGLTKTSETALMEGAMGLVPGVVGAVAALLTRGSRQRRAVIGLIVGGAAAVALVIFFQSIWPML
jgi:hypothetical protein